QADDSQASCHSAFAASYQHTEQENFCVLPTRLGKQGLKNYNQTQQFGRQCSHTEIFSGKRVFPELTRSAVTFSKTADFVHFVMPARSAGITKWTKSSQKAWLHTARANRLLRAEGMKRGGVMDMKTRRRLNICAFIAFAVCCGLVCVSGQQTQTAQQPRP